MSKLKYEDIKLEVEAEGWKLISSSYTNLKTQMEFMCPNGHSNFLTLAYWRKHRDCPICKSNKYYKTNDAAKKKAGHRVLAFDQASITSGWAVFDGSELIKFGHWTSESMDSTGRISKTKQWVASMLQMWEPDLVIFEDIQLQHFDNGDGVITFKKLAHLQGVLKNYCYENGYTYKIVPPPTWRCFNEIKGRTRNDQKRNAQLKVKALYDVSATQDEADAILIGRWAAHDNSQNITITF